MELNKMNHFIGMEDQLCRVEGMVTVSAFKPGVIGRLMGFGMPLREAIQIATHAGRMKHQVKMHNLTTTSGRQFIARRISGQESAGLTYIAFGTGTTAPVVSDTQLVTETLRKALTECTQGDIYVYSSVFLLASECSFYIREGGLFGGMAASLTANSGSMLCRFLVGYDNSVDQDDLTIQHTGKVML
jgi:hypothetical protein